MCDMPTYRKKIVPKQASEWRKRFTESTVLFIECNEETEEPNTIRENHSERQKGKSLFSVKHSKSHMMSLFLHH